MSFFKQYGKLFSIPALIILGIIGYFVCDTYGFHKIAGVIIIMTILIGSAQLFHDTVKSILNREFALDYIAILAISVGLASGQYIVAAFIVLMMAGGNTLEKYGLAQAKHALTGLVDRIPSEVMVINEKGESLLMKAELVLHDMLMRVRKGEVIALDGVLTDEHATVDESSLTGEPYPVEKQKNQPIISGTVNVGEPITILVTATHQNSTYSKIVEMVQNAQDDKSPFIRLADQYSVIFTLITLFIAAVAYYIHRDRTFVLAVLVIATPCPLILATPIALMGGMSSSAKKLIIVKRLAAIEAMARVDSLMFDKTGTITLGKPQVIHVEQHDQEHNLTQLLGIARTIEQNSLHPLAKALVEYTQHQHINSLLVTQIKEIIGHGIQGEFEGKTYVLSKEKGVGMRIGMWCNDKHVLSFDLQDEIKEDSISTIRDLIKQGLDVSIYTGDHADAAKKVGDAIDPAIHVVADCKPEDKLMGIQQLHEGGKVVAMVGDGINDAPALAQADVGMVFSHQEQTATTETADVVFLAGTFQSVVDSLRIARTSVGIAKQSILFGIGLSTIGMILASLGYIPPLFGAGAQELIDVVAILNALRASRLS